MSAEAGTSQDLIQLVYKGGSMLFDVGKGSVKLAAYLQARLKAASENKLYGQIDLAKLNKDGQPIVCYNLRQEDFKKIKSKARKYGLIYGAICETKGNANSEVNLFIRQVDAVKLERLLESLKIATINPDLSKVTVEDTDANVIKAEVELNRPEDVKKKTSKNKESEDPLAKSPSEKKSVKSEKKREDRPSVRAEIQTVKAELAIEEEKRMKEMSLNGQLEEEFASAKTKAGKQL